MTESDQTGTNVAHPSLRRGTLRPVSVQGEPARGSVAAPTPTAPADRAASASAAARPGTDAPTTPVRPGGDAAADVDGVPLEDLESEVYTVRDLQGDERDEVSRALAQARSEMSEATYRRALVLARDSVLLSIEECINGAVAMEWEPMPRPEFSLETIEAAVAEQERNGEGSAEEPEGRTA
jgi:hypothetical protein